MSGQETLTEETLRIARRNRSCKDGYRDLLGVNNFGQACIVFKKYWPDVIGMHLKDTILFLNEHYVANKEAFNLRGIYYNDSANRGLVLIYNCKDVVLSGDCKAHIFGHSEVTLRGHARGNAHDSSHLMLMEYASAVLNEHATCSAWGRSFVNARDENLVEANELCEVVACGKTLVHAKGWRKIVAMGDARVVSSKKQHIEMKGNNQLELMQ